MLKKSLNIKLGILSGFYICCKKFRSFEQGLAKLLANEIILIFLKHFVHLK